MINFFFLFWKIDHPHTMTYPMAYPMEWAMVHPIFCPLPRTVDLRYTLEISFFFSLQPL